jgi:hypothetical protein
MMSLKKSLAKIPEELISVTLYKKITNIGGKYLPNLARVKYLPLSSLKLLKRKLSKLIKE